MSAVPEGARCGRHPERGAVALCARCGDFLCERCAIAIGAAWYCAGCEERAGAPFPWERRGEIGLARALWATTAGTLARTRATFAPGFRDRSALPALAYAVLLSTPVAWIDAAASGLEGSPPNGPLSWLSSDAGRLALAVGAPLQTLLAVGMLATGWWLGLVVAGVPRRTFSHVVRAAAYVHGAVAPLSLVALVPGIEDGPLRIVVGMLTLVLQARALRAVTRASAWRIAAAAIVALLFPVVPTLALAAFLSWIVPAL
ncbi:MAG TPA: hypothetical protein VIL20_27310 [Sandaracinaceae bacterium]